MVTTKKFYHILGYSVYYGDKILEEIEFPQEGWLKKDKAGKEKYKEELEDFFKDVLKKEGKSQQQITDNFEVFLTVREYKETTRERIIALFEAGDDNTVKTIAKRLNLSDTYVTQVISEHLRQLKNKRNEDE